MSVTSKKVKTLNGTGFWHATIEAKDPDQPFGYELYKQRQAKLIISGATFAGSSERGFHGSWAIEVHKSAEDDPHYGLILRALSLVDAGRDGHFEGSSHHVSADNLGPVTMTYSAYVEHVHFGKKDRGMKRGMEALITLIPMSEVLRTGSGQEAESL